MERIVLTWKQVYKAIDEVNLHPDSKVYGIPRGGSIVAGLMGCAVDSWEDADVLIDDINDSGNTAQRWKEATGKNVLALFDKTKFSRRAWLVFPWEVKDTEDDIRETIVRQLEFINEDPAREGLLETPDRIIKSWDTFFGGYKLEPQDVLKTDFGKEKYDQMVVLKDIEFYSHCEHHMVPFFGKARIAYIPNKRVVGISKLARLLEVFSRRLQIQERLTSEIAHALNDHLKPLGVGVILEAQHMCMTSRGVAKQNSIMTTSCLLGEFKDNAQTREEFLNL